MGLASASHSKKKISACNLSPRRHYFFTNVFLFFVACRWFCHFDDDNYVNVPRLVDKLSQFDHRKDWYLGKPSLPEPLEILDRDTNHQQVKHYLKLYIIGGILSSKLKSEKEIVKKPHFHLSFAVHPCLKSSYKFHPTYFQLKLRNFYFDDKNNFFEKF